MAAGKGWVGVGAPKRFATPEEFLKRRCFFCPFLNASITRELCVVRQRPAEMIRYFGRKVKLFDAPLDRYCRSGKCDLGAENRAALQARKSRGKGAGKRKAKK